MQPIEITSAAQNAAKGALATSFNTSLADACRYFGATPFAIDFDGRDEKRSFYEGNISRDSLITQLKPRISTCVLSALAGECTNEQKGRTYSGPLEVSIEFHVRTKNGNYDPTMAALCHSVVSAVVQTFNAGNISGGPVFYGGSLKFAIGELEFFRDFWLQTITFQVLFEVNT